MPRKLLKRIDSIRRRAVMLVWTRAVCLTLVCIVTSIMVAFLLDFSIRPESQAMRWLLLASCLFTFCIAGAKWILPVLNYRPERVDIARRIENAGHGWHDELTTSVQLAEQVVQNGDATNDLETSMVARTQQRLTQAAHSLTARIQPVVWPSMMLVGIAALAGLLFAAQRTSVLYSLQRIATPWSDAEWPRKNELVLGSLPDQVARGSSLEIVAHDRNSRLGQAVLETEASTGSQSIALSASKSRIETAVFRGRLNDIQQDLRLRVTGGDDQTDWHSIRVVDVPNLVAAEVSWLHPDINDGDWNPISESFECWPNSGLLISGQANMPLKSATLVMQIGETPQRFPLEVDQSNIRLSTSPLLSSDGEFWIELQSAKGIANESTARHSFQLIIDQPPLTSVILDENLAGPNSVVNIQSIVQDELSIESARLSVRVNQITDSPEVVNRNESLVRSEVDHSTYESKSWLDLATIPHLEVGERLLFSVSARDRAGNSAASKSEEIEIVSDERLARVAAGHLEQLGRLMSELQTRQTVLNSRVGQLNNSSPIRHVQTIIANQNHILDSFGIIEQSSEQPGDRPGDRTAVGQTINLQEFAERHRLAWNGIQTTNQVGDIQNSIRTEVAPQIRTELGRITRKIRLLSKSDNPNIDLADLADLQNRFLERLATANNLIQTTTSFEEIATRVSQLQEEQKRLIRETQTAQQLALSNPRANLTTELNQLLAKQTRLRAITEQVIRQMIDRIKDANSSGEVNPNFQQIADAYQIADSERLLSRMLESETGLSDKRFGPAMNSQTIATDTLTRMSLILTPTSEALGTELAGGLAQQIAEMTNELKKFDERLNQYSDKDGSPNEMNSEVRQQLDREKIALQQKMVDLKNAIESSSFSGLDEFVQEAIDSVSGSSSEIDPRSVSQESKDIQRAIRQLDRAALEIASQSQQEAGDNVDLTEVLEFLTQLKTAQTGINEWSQARVGQSKPDESEMQSVIALQQQVVTGFAVVADKLKQYATAMILTDSIVESLESSLDRLQRSLLDDETLRTQAQIVSEMQQLSSAVEIQLESNRDPSETTTDNSENSEDENQATASISSFELTMLYVLQQGLQKDTEQWRTELLREGQETESLLQVRLQLSARQKKVADVLTGLIEKQPDESLPTLPDF